MAATSRGSFTAVSPQSAHQGGAEGGGRPCGCSRHLVDAKSCLSLGAAANGFNIRSKGTSEPVIEYMPGSITTNKEAQEVGYIFLPEEGGSLVATDTQHESSSKTQLAAPPPIPGQVATPKYERKFAPWLPCSVWGGDQVVCTDKLGKTTITVVMDDGTVKPPGGQSSGTWELPGAHHLQPEEAKGECYSSCDFYWAYTVTHAIYF